MEQNCKSCKHHSTYKRPKVIDATGFGDQMMFDDKDEVVYVCKAPNGPRASTEVGLDPVHCPSWAETRKLSDEDRAQMDRWMARFAERTTKDGDL